MKWNNIIIHCSDSTWGSASEIRKWHLEKGFRDIGYHFNIPNGRIRPNFYLPELDGTVEVGRPLDGDPIVEVDEIGAHALGYNDSAIGVCLIGKNVFSMYQLSTLTKLIVRLQLQFNIPLERVLGHYEVDQKKTCPNMDMTVYRRSLDPLGLFYKPQ